jgi:hypothetical protein
MNHQESRENAHQTRGKKLIGSKPPLRIEDVWSILTKLHVEERVWDSAMFNLVTRSKHRGYDVVRLEVEDMARLA